MTEQQFKTLPGEEKAEFVNEKIKNGKSLADIAKSEFGRSQSWLSKLLNEEGFYMQAGFYVKRQKQPADACSDLTELFKYKDKLITLAKQFEASEPVLRPDFVEVSKLESKEQTTTIRLKAELIEQLDALSKQFGTTKSMILSLALLDFIKKYK